MDNLTPEQVANFVYWICESTNLRGIHNERFERPGSKLYYIETVLLQAFLQKYPDGILTGWTDTKSETIKQEKLPVLQSIREKLVVMWDNEFHGECDKTLLTAIRHSIKDLEIVTHLRKTI